MIKKRRSALLYMLESLIPYTDANLKLVFHPHYFFNELDKQGKYNHRTLKNAYYKAKSNGLITYHNGEIRLHATILSQPQVSQPMELPNGQQLLVMFDVPEELANKRRQLRSLLKELKFTQNQLSVWQSTLDYRSVVHELINELDINSYVRVYLASQA